MGPPSPSPSFQLNNFQPELPPSAGRDWGCQGAELAALSCCPRGEDKPGRGKEFLRFPPRKCSRAGTGQGLLAREGQVLCPPQPQRVRNGKNCSKGHSQEGEMGILCIVNTTILCETDDFKPGQHSSLRSPHSPKSRTSRPPLQTHPSVSTPSQGCFPTEFPTHLSALGCSSQVISSRQGMHHPARNGTRSFPSKWNQFSLDMPPMISALEILGPFLTLLGFAPKNPEPLNILLGAGREPLVPDRHRATIQIQSIHFSEFCIQNPPE